MNRIKEIRCKSFVTKEAFRLPGKAIQDTQWTIEPADPTQHTCGQIQKGEIVWFDHELFGSGPDWQLALLNDRTPVYVNPRHFAHINTKSKN